MTPAANLSRSPVAVIVHLSGRYRGKIQRLEGDRLAIDTSPEAEIRFSEQDLTPGLSAMPESGPYAVLERGDDTWELRAALEADIWVNGRRTEARALASGDVLEIGEGGPVLRFRLYPAGSKAYKSVTEVFSDCAECARHGRNIADRAGALLAGPPMELLTRTAPLVRLAVVVVLVALAVVVGRLWVRGESLEQRLLAETEVVQALLERGAEEEISGAEVSALRDRLSENVARIEALEARSEARAKVIAASSRSVVFIQGGWGLDDPDGRPVRFVGVGPDGNLLPGVEEPGFTVDGDGPPVEVLYTGTAFVVSSDGYLLTNRHVALPWDADAPIEELEQQGLTPVVRRFVGYLPGMRESFDVELVRASDTLDVALLRCKPVDAEVQPLQLAETSPRPGDEVIVMGYPTGIQALLARADPVAVQAILDAGPLDFWQIVRRLSEDDLIAPLATVGVVGQVTTTSVVYDAETTHGGSGGPVLNLNGQVLAVNAAILPQFGGSNLGVPAAEALRLLHEPGGRGE
jgi:S1-C subfamily serine protease